jgi:hypothetical protein
MCVRVLIREQNNNRIEKIHEWLPKALEKRYESDCQGTANWADMFKKAMNQGFRIE